jgi:hypothetical protein
VRDYIAVKIRTTVRSDVVTVSSFMRCRPGIRKDDSALLVTLGDRIFSFLAGC